LRGERDLAQAVANARAMGWEPVVGRHVLERSGYLAGPDVHRLADLNDALRDGRIDGIWCVRGGYGVTRILDGVDYDALRARPRAVIGYSDISALHAAIGRRSGVQSYHGPTGRAVLTPFTRNSLERAVLFGVDSCGVAHGARTIREGVAVGRLAGGNLALLAALVGTAYMPDLGGAILVLEDVNEPVYRVDRMLRQLWMAGVLAGIVGIAFGQCTECDVAVEQEGAGARRVLDDVLREVAEGFNVPCVAGLPIGHVDDQWTVPLGAVATLDGLGLTLTVGEME
jgi:muramoyltetrapeptide carboxypeptidase